MLIYGHGPFLGGLQARKVPPGQEFVTVDVECSLDLIKIITSTIYMVLDYREPTYGQNMQTPRRKTICQLWGINCW